jgi:hypothetical protein
LNFHDADGFILSQGLLFRGDTIAATPTGDNGIAANHRDWNRDGWHDWTALDDGEA